MELLTSDAQVLRKIRIEIRQIVSESVYLLGCNIGTERRI